MKNDETTSGFSAVPLDIPVRAQFEQWVRSHHPYACFDDGHDGKYIVLGMEGRLEAFRAGMEAKKGSVK